MLEEEKWTTPSMTYFRPHFMMPAPGDGTHDVLGNGAGPPMQRAHPAQPWWLNYDQALDLGPNQQNKIQHQPQHKIIKHEQVDQTKYGFDQVNYSAGQPSIVKKKEDQKYACDQCEYVATQKSSLSRHKMTIHEGIRPQKPQNGKMFDCDLCGFQLTQLTSLKRHKLTKHSGAAYPCDICGYIGTSPNNLRLHKASKHEGVRYPCDLCEMEFTQTGVLNRHKQQKHFGGSMQQALTYDTNGQPQKVHRDPNAPKRPLSGFFHFSNVGRSKVKAANPDMSVGDISKELARRWHALDEITRGMFEEMASNDKERFQREKQEYRNSPMGAFKQTRARRDPNAPKRPLCAFMLYSNDHRNKAVQESPQFALGHKGEIVKELGKRWAAETPEVRKKYNDMSAAEKERFVREKSEYQLTVRPGYQWRGQRAKKDPSAPKRNVPAFMWFSNDEREKVAAVTPGLRVSEMAKELGRRWALADPETRARYEQMSDNDKQRYEKEKHEWHMEQRQKDLDSQAAQNQAQSQNQGPSQNQVPSQSLGSSQNQGPSQVQVPSQNQSPIYMGNPAQKPWTPQPVVQGQVVGSPHSQPIAHHNPAPSPNLPIINNHPTSPPITIHHPLPPSVSYGY